MPEMDGLETLRRVRREYPQLRSSCSARSPSAARGDTGSTELGSRRLRDQGFQRRVARSLDGAPAEELVPKIKHSSMCRRKAVRGRSEPAHVVARAGRAQHVRRSKCEGAAKVIVIGVSTGGPTALGSILPELPAGSRCRSWSCSTCRLSSPGCSRASSLILPVASRRS